MAVSKFDAKSFNPQAFKYLVERVPNLKRNSILKSGAVISDAEIKSVMTAQDGTGYASFQIKGLLEGGKVKYDGSTDINSRGSRTYSWGVQSYGWADGFIEKDFSTDITGGQDFMGNVASQVGEYKDEVNFGFLLSILKGIFAMDTSDFASRHTLDITGETTKVVGASTLNNAIQKACMQNKNKFKLVFMHSAVATNLENLKLLDYMKGVDENGIERDLAMATWNGRIVIIDDEMPTEQVKTANGTAGEYTLTVSTALASGDTISVDGIEYAYSSGATTATAQATAIYNLLNANAGESAKYTITNPSNGVVKFVEKSNGAFGKPVLDVTGSTTGVVAEATVTEGVLPTYETNYTSYVLGEGALVEVDLGAKVPFEMDRDAKTNGGQDTLYIRERKVIAPRYISFIPDAGEICPDNASFETGSKWELVNDGAVSKTYIDHKNIAIARIISRG